MLAGPDIGIEVAKGGRRLSYGGGGNELSVAEGEFEFLTMEFSDGEKTGLLWYEVSRSVGH